LPASLGDITINGNACPAPSNGYGFAFQPGGRIRNVLFGQVVALSLNVNNPVGFGGDLNTLALANICGVTFPSSVITYLTNAANVTVGGLLELANRALAGEAVGVSLTDINDAVDAINNRFDGCKSAACTDGSVIGAGLGTTVEKFVPTEYALFQSYPNPFNPIATIRFDIPTASVVTLNVYNILGQVVATLVEGEYREAGRYDVKFDGSRVGSGVYFYRISAGSFQSLKKMVLIK
jgi:hypothetical protein